MITKLRLVLILTTLMVCLMVVLFFVNKSDEKQFLVFNHSTQLYEAGANKSNDNKSRSHVRVRAKNAVLSLKKTALSETENLVAVDSPSPRKPLSQSLVNNQQLPLIKDDNTVDTPMVNKEPSNLAIEYSPQPIQQIEVFPQPIQESTTFSRNLHDPVPDDIQTASVANPRISEEREAVYIQFPQSKQSYVLFDDSSNFYEMEEISQNTGYQIKLRAAAFFPAQKLFRSIYGNAGATYEVEATKILPKSLQGWINANWFFKNGHVEGSKNKTEIKIANLSLGINWVYEWRPTLTGYLGLGANITRVYISNRSFCGQQNETKYGIGGVLKSGVQYRFFKNFIVEVFVDYLYQPVKFEERRNVGGFKTGAGLGINF